MNFELLKWFDKVPDWIQVLAVYGGWSWGVYQFLRARTYALKLEPDIKATLKSRNNLPSLEIETSLKNIGKSRVLLDKTCCYIRVFEGQNQATFSGLSDINWQPIDTLPLFAKDGAAESDETLKDITFVTPPKLEYAFLRLDMKVVSKGIFGLARREWKKSVILPYE